MDYVVKMAVADGIYDGSDGISCFFLGLVLFLDNAVKELSSRHKFQNYVEVLLSLEDLEHIDYIWMVNLLVRARLTYLWCSTSLRREMWSSSPILSLF